MVLSAFRVLASSTNCGDQETSAATNLLRSKDSAYGTTDVVWYGVFRMILEGLLKQTVLSTTTCRYYKLDVQQ